MSIVFILVISLIVSKKIIGFVGLLNGTKQKKMKKSIYNKIK